MILIADSGSTKADWRWISNKNEVTAFKTVGLNPYFTDSQKVEREIYRKLPDDISPESIEDVYFYGAGCAAEERKKVIAVGLEQIFPNARLHVETDILGAARALFGTMSGIAVILGTGANSAEYNGEKIVANVPSLGYILGDEGSGAHLGTQLVKSFLNRELPHDLHVKFANKYNQDLNSILKAVYKEDFPNRFLASFTLFLSENIDNEYIRNIILKSFLDMFNKTVCMYNSGMKSEIKFVGSIAWHFRNQLEESANTKGLVVSEIIEYPADRLVKYHIG